MGLSAAVAAKRKGFTTSKKSGDELAKKKREIDREIFRCFKQRMASSFLHNNNIN